MIKGVGGTFGFVAWDTSANAPKTGDSGNFTLRWGKDGAYSAPANSPSEVDSTNAKGEYKITITNAEALCDFGELVGVSSTSNVAIIATRINFNSGPALRINLAQAGASGSITLDSGASATDSLYKGLSVSIIAGTGAGQGGRIITAYVGSTKVATVTPAWTTTPDSTSVFALVPATADVESWLLNAVAATSAGIPNVNTTAINNISAASVTTVNANQGTTQPTNFTGTAGSALIKTDMIDAASVAVTLDSNNVLNVSTKYVGGILQTAIDIGGTWTAARAAHLDADISSRSTLTQTQVTGGTYSIQSASCVLGDARIANLDASVSSRLGASGYTAPPTAAQNATAVWTDSTSSDFATNGTPGKILVTQLGGAFTNQTGSVFSVASLANAPSGSASDPWAVNLPGIYTGTQAGALLAAAGLAADPMQNTGSTYTNPLSLGYVVFHLGNNAIVVTAPLVVAPLDFSINQGQDYLISKNTQITFNVTTPSLAGGGSAYVLIQNANGPAQKFPCTVINAGLTNQAQQLQFTKIQDAAFPIGRVKYQLVLVEGDGTTTKISGTMNVGQQIV